MDNFVSQLTGPGVAAIAVVRLTGPNVTAFLQRHFSRPTPIGRCIHGNLSDNSQVIDDCVAVRFKDGVDFNLHGGTWVTQSVLRVAQSAGFAISTDHDLDAPSEIWQQVLLALQNARTEQAVKMLLAQPGAWEQPVNLPDVIADQSGYWMLATPRVAIVGRANVGKSTLANQLFGQARSITADLPGTTRDWVGEIANIDGLAVMLVDTPGQRQTSNPIEAAAITASAQQIAQADLIVVVLDLSMPPDREVLARYPDAIIVANKSDRPHLWSPLEWNAIPTDAVHGAGIPELRRRIRNHFGCDPMDLSRPRWWTHQQRDHLKSSGILKTS